MSPRDLETEGPFPVNGLEYWEELFAGEWDARDGPGQTRFFAHVALDALPLELASEIRREELTVVDWGCAEGDAVDVLNRALGGRVTGVDISAEAVARARGRFPGQEFVCTKTGPLARDFDVLFTSNTLEHFEHPIEELTRLLERVRRYAVALVPFQETERYPGHVVTFDWDSFPSSIAGFRLVASRVVDCRGVPGTRWNGKQILVVYAGPEAALAATATLADAAAGALDELRSAETRASAQADRLAESVAARERLQAQLASAMLREREAARRWDRLLALTPALRALDALRSSRWYKAPRVVSALVRDPVTAAAAAAVWATGAYRRAGIDLPAALGADPVGRVRDVLAAVRDGDTPRIDTGAAPPGGQLGSWVARRLASHQSPEDVALEEARRALRSTS